MGSDIDVDYEVIVMLKIVKIFGPRGRGPPIWDILDSHDENSKNIWAKGTWSSIWDFWDSDDENRYLGQGDVVVQWWPDRPSLPIYI